MFTETGMVVALTHVLMPFMVLSVWAALQRLDPQIENAAVSLGRGPVHDAAPHRAAADHARHAVGRDHRVRARGQRLRDARHHRRPPAQGRRDAGLRRVPQHAQLAAGRGGRGAAAGRAGADRRRQQPRWSSAATRRCSDEPQRPARARSSTRCSSSSCWRRSWSSASSPSRPKAILSLPDQRLVAALVHGRSRAIPSSSRPSGAACGSARCRSAFARCCSRCRRRSPSRAIASAAATRMTALFMSPLMIPHVVLGIAFLRFFTADRAGRHLHRRWCSRTSSSCCRSRCA